MTVFPIIFMRKNFNFFFQILLNDRSVRNIFVNVQTFTQSFFKLGIKTTTPTPPSLVYRQQFKVVAFNSLNEERKLSVSLKNSYVNLRKKKEKKKFFFSYQKIIEKFMIF